MTEPIYEVVEVPQKLYYNDDNVKMKQLGG